MIPETKLERYNKDTDTMANAMRIQKDKRSIQRTGDHVYLNVRKRPKDGFERRRREEEAPDCWWSLPRSPRRRPLWWYEEGDEGKKTLGFGVRAQSSEFVGRIGYLLYGASVPARVHHSFTSERGLHRTGEANPLGWQHYLNLSVLFLQTIGSFVTRTVSLFRPLAPVCEEAAAAAAESRPEAAAGFCRSFRPCSLSRVWFLMLAQQEDETRDGIHRHISNGFPQPFFVFSSVVALFQMLSKRVMLLERKEKST
ncbi:hypothetical protein MUK42_34279 [Musa troglodytarum]|uniref:Uncharacterized protein n=1 Tax=Musa troglodytarum TaxID=320322 RepID=A0A9E7JZJ1_9LILI|nr:hypothetical protein MUK42_34279 [Musa troglodytarum]